jgi:hypothetical protein
LFGFKVIETVIVDFVVEVAVDSSPIVEVEQFEKIFLLVGGE